MTDPKRWLDEPPFAGSLATQLILAGKRLDLPPEAVEQGWSKFSAGIASSAVVVAYASEATGAASSGTAGAGAAAGIGLSATVLVKCFVLGAALGVGATSVVPVARYVTRPTPTSSATFSVPAPERARATHARDVATAQGKIDRGILAPAEPDAKVPAVSAPPVPAGTAASAPELSGVAELSPLPAALPSSAPQSEPLGSDTNRLKLEALELAKASNLLERGDTSGALGVLEASRARFANGSMVEERDALVIDALAKQGNLELARDAARRFVVRFPKSPLVERVKRTSGLE